eukprot:15362339-Ditylum_brightwellii.AAC.1
MENKKCPCFKTEDKKTNHYISYQANKEPWSGVEGELIKTFQRNNIKPALQTLLIGHIQSKRFKKFTVSTKT